MPVALESMLDIHEAFSEDTHRRSCEPVSCADGGCNNGHDLFFHPDV